MNIRIQKYICMSCLIFFSCQATKNLTIIPKEELINTELPKDFSQRTFFQNTSIVRGNLDNLVGSIIIIDTAGVAEIAMLPSYVKSGAKTTITPVKDGGVYESKITSSWSSNGNFKYLFNLGLDFAKQQAYEIVIEDAAYASLNSDSINWSRILEIAKTPKSKTTKCRCFALNSFLSTILYKGFSQVDTKSNLAIGDVFQVGNLSYHSMGNKLIKDYRISFWCYDIDKAAEFLKTNNAFDSQEENQKTENIIYLKTLAKVGSKSKVLSTNVISKIK